MVSSVCYCNKNIVEGQTLDPTGLAPSDTSNGTCINTDNSAIQSLKQSTEDSCSGDNNLFIPNEYRYKDGVCVHVDGTAIDKIKNEPPISAYDIYSCNEQIQREAGVIEPDDKLKWISFTTGLMPNTNLNEQYSKANDMMSKLFNGNHFGIEADQHLQYLATISGTPHDGINNIKQNINNFNDFGKSNNINSLNYIELIIRNFIARDINTLYVEINKVLGADISSEGDSVPIMCSQDLTIYALVFLLYLYGITGNRSLDPNTYSNSKNISDKLTKYIPDIMGKIQQLYIEKCQSDSIDPLKNKIVEDIFNILLKNNETKISFTGFNQIMTKLEKVKSIYIILFMICITYVAVKFMGMFNMNMNV